MFRTGTLQRAEQAIEQLNKAPQLLIRNKLHLLINILQSDKMIEAQLQSLFQRERPNIRQLASYFTSGISLGTWIELRFDDSLERQAAFGYQVLMDFLAQELPVELFFRFIYKAMEPYMEIHDQHVNDKEARVYIHTSDVISCFSETVISPIINYLESIENIDDILEALMLRYKQRSEWFEGDHLKTLALERKGTPSDQVEQRLKQNFYRYLFDEGLDFSVEAVSPKMSGRVDILSAKLPNGRRLVVEAKVYDGKNRDESKVSNGISQAADYAQEWLESRAYLLVFNIPENSVIQFTGARQEGNIWLIQSLGKEIRIVDINLRNILTASKAYCLKKVEVNCIK